ncbi:GLPGLI family protein [Dyadobacter fermentans]|jgi:GLPGLI family protein|uniref:GLPGLI family protein n=1 Tax=Dyadobacter fermentans TaxID=94254 RepID=UPI001CBBB11B|nr:GLPGLI family protein [Dyadobacter fermentans]MBZ1361081.1 GLPGLI family protein [Dyadobacter fermentans]
MKKLLSIIALLLAAAPDMLAQTSGQINYEVVRKIDQSRLRFMVNGEEVKQGDPNFPTDVPDTRTIGQKVLFAGNFVRENRDEENMMKRVIQEPGGMPQMTNAGRPFEEYAVIDIAGQKVLTFVTVGQEKEAHTYKTEAPIEPTAGWQLTQQTKKIAGYLCQKAVVNYHKEPYAVWFTTELPFRYSPVPNLTPEKGVVLLVEGSREQFRATKVSLGKVDEKAVMPDVQAEKVSAEQMTDIRQKAIADFHQKMGPGGGGI